MTLLAVQVPHLTIYNDNGTVALFNVEFTGTADSVLNDPGHVPVKT